MGIAEDVAAMTLQRKVLHVCEIAGHDQEGIGSEKMPFRSPLRALESVNGDESVEIVIRKDHVEGYQPISGAALKKTKKTLELNEKKKAKAAETAMKVAETAAARAAEEAKKLDAAKAVVLVNDPALPAPTKVNTFFFWIIHGSVKSFARLYTAGRMMRKTNPPHLRSNNSLHRLKLCTAPTIVGKGY